MNTFHKALCYCEEKVNTGFFKSFFSVFCAFSFILPFASGDSLIAQPSYKTYTKYVNPFVGTGGHGHTFPGATMPFGMVQLSPDTRIDGSWDGCGGYHHDDSIIYGFTHTHLSGTGITDYGDVMLMPTTGTPVVTALKNGSYKEGYASHFSHKKESASPGYYQVHLDDDNIDVELTAAYRVGFHRYVFPKSNQSNIILDLTHRDKVLESSIRVIDSRHIEGMRRSRAWAPDQILYFAIEFSKQYEAYGIFVNDSLQKNLDEANGINIKSFFQFHTASGEPIYVKVAISAVSTAAAWGNMEAELQGWDFEQARANAEATWNYNLSKIEVKGGTEEQKRVFYTALYHTMIAPNLYSDGDGSYRGRDMQIHKSPVSPYYTVYSLWDTFRGLHPLFTIIVPKQDGDFIKTFLLEYEQGGRLPVWELSSNETDCMIGYHSVSVIADAAVKGITGFDQKEALYAMTHSAELDHYGLNAYRDHGYIGIEDEMESVSKTLEYSYDDWCISQLAIMVKDDVTYKEYHERAQWWKNVFDPSTSFMRPRKNGGFLSPFDPYEVNFNYTEANAWQYRFFVPQDISGMIKAMGGKEKFSSRLDTLFSTTSKTTGREQADISGMIGQYAQGNEPSHHMAYLYDYAEKPWKTQQLVRKIMTEFYHDTPDGLIGNEDCGQMSAWFVLSAMGFYSVTPGSPYYAIGSPLFDTVKIHLDNQKIFTIIANNNSPDHVFIQSMRVNNQPTDSFYISHEMILKGKTVSFEMGSNPLMQIKGPTSPPSLIATSLIVTDPLIQASSNTFHESQAIALKSRDAGTKIFYTLDGSDPSIHSLRYTQPFSIHESTTVKAIAVNEAGVLSKIVTGKFFKNNKNWKVNYITKYSQYTGGGDQALADGQSGGKDFRNGMWQGWWGNDMEVIVDLGKLQSVSKVGAEFLQDERTWILMPSKVTFEASTDGKDFKEVASINNDIPDTLVASTIKQFTATIPSQQMRFVKIKATNYGKLPAWHQGAGGDAWIFSDEIFIE